MRYRQKNSAAVRIWGRRGKYEITADQDSGQGGG